MNAQLWVGIALGILTAMVIHALLDEMRFTCHTECQPVLVEAP